MDWVFRQNHHQSTKQRQGCEKIPKIHVLGFGNLELEVRGTVLTITTSICPILINVFYIFLEENLIVH